MNSELFVENVKKLCFARGELPTIACKKAGVGGSFISDINRGRVPSVEKVQKLAVYLGATTSDLLGEDASSLPTQAQLKAEVAKAKQKRKPTPLRGSGLSDEALEVAAAYDRAAKKDQDTVRFILADCLPRAAAARGDIDLSREDLSGVTVAGEDSEHL